MRSRWLLASALTCALACSSSSDPRDLDDSLQLERPADSEASAFITETEALVSCRLTQRCCGAPRRFDDLDDCITKIPTSFPKAYLDAALERGALRIDLDRAIACFERLDALSCEDWRGGRGAASLIPDYSVCERFFLDARLDAGQACEASWECRQEGFRCADPNFSGMRVCTPPVEMTTVERDGCFRDNDCRSGRVCLRDPETGDRRCGAPRGDGQPCTNANECASKICEVPDEADTSAGTCVSICAERQPA